MRNRKRARLARRRDPQASFDKHLAEAREAGDRELVALLEEHGREHGFLKTPTPGEALNAEIRAKWRGDSASELDRRRSGKGEPSE
jgi:hypothetical protein